jgi:hypothetical protein
MTTIGLLASYAAWGWRGPVTAVVSAGVLAIFVALMVGLANGLRATIARVRMGFGAGLVLAAAIALMGVFGAAGLCVVIILTATSPQLLQLVRRRRRATGRRPQAHPALSSSVITAAPNPDLRRLDDRALCLAWRHSYPLLSAACSAQDRLVVVQRRQEYLDELHRRSPQGLAAWVAAGGRASSNPLPYLTAHQCRNDPPEEQASA